ncbi:MAG: AAA family ATPase [Tetrasphaera sp.]|nr:AAA family ATPase [Tetrasphaera sp.]
MRLHVVTGKGGVGKTTVAAALALALARGGRRVLLAEVEGRQGISQTFDVPPLGTSEALLVQDSSGGELWGISVDAKAALLEYLQIFYKLGRAGSALEKVGAIDFATTIAPGVRDVLLIGKVYEAARRTDGPRRGQGRPVWDAVVLDAPPTGRVARFLGVNAEVADIAKVGPIRAQADSITALLTSPETAVHVVTLLEEMPVQETVDAVAELRDGGFGLGMAFVNLVRDPLLDEVSADLLTGTPAADLEPLIKEQLLSVGVKATAPMVRGLLREGFDHLARITLQEEMGAELTATGLPLVALPALVDGVEEGGIGVLAEVLAEAFEAFEGEVRR